jgi:hypothetical protein
MRLENTDREEDQAIEALEDMISDPLNHPIQEIIDRVTEIFEIIGRLDEEWSEANQTIENQRIEIDELKVDRDN